MRKMSDMYIDYGVEGDSPESISSKVIKGVIDNREFVIGPVCVSVPDSAVVSFAIKDNHIDVAWSINPEVDIPGPVDPDILGARLYTDHAEIDTHFGTVKVKY